MTTLRRRQALYNVFPRTRASHETRITAMDRRVFLKGTGKAVTLGAATLALGGKVLGANDRVRIAVCGVRGRGHDHIRGFHKLPGVELVALCDVDENVLNGRLGGGEALGVSRRKAFVDIGTLPEANDGAAGA